MNNTTQNILIFGAGALVGSVATYFICKNKLEKEFEEILNEELEAQKSQLHGTKTENVVFDEQIVQEYVSVETTQEEEINEEQDFEGEGRIPYSSYSEGGEVSAEPYIISAEQYYDDQTVNDKCSVSYYVDDDTLVDEDESIIHDIDAHIGEESLNHFGDRSEDPAVVFVRNERLAIDYEVIKIEGSYSEEVLGIEAGTGGN